MDKELKQQAAETAERMGLSLSAVVNAMLRNFVQTQELHVTSAPRLTPYAEKIVAQAMKDYEAGVNISEPFGSAGEMMDHLMKITKNDSKIP